MRLNLIDGFSIEVDGDRVSRLRTRKTEELLAWLSLHSKSATPRAQLIDEFWGEEEASSARQKLRLALHSIRSVIGDRLQTEGELVRVVDVEVDILTSDISTLGTGWRLMPEHELGWLDSFQVSLMADCQVQTLGKVASIGGEADPQAYVSQLMYLLSVDRSEPEWYRRLYRFFSSRNERGAARVIAAAAKLELGADCPVELLSAQTTRIRSGFVGRVAELISLSEQLLGPTEPALLTIVGIGGVGKSELARELSRLAPDEDIEALWISCQSIQSPTELQSAMEAELCRALQLPEGHAVDPMMVPSVLLVLDNCERIDPACLGVIRDFLVEGSGLRVLLTSQQALGDEPTLKLKPMGLPFSKEKTEIERSEAGSLFIQAAGLVAGRYEPADLLEACRACAGIPLALLIVAHEARKSSVREVLGDLLHRNAGQGLRNHEDLRSMHSSLHTTLEWGFGCLAPEIRLVCHQLAIFEERFGTFALEVFSIDQSTVDELVDRGWVNWNPDTKDWSLPPPIRLFLSASSNKSAQFLAQFARSTEQLINEKFELDYASLLNVASIHHFDLERFYKLAVDQDWSADQIGNLLIGLTVDAFRHGRYGEVKVRLEQLVKDHPALPSRYHNMAGSACYFMNELDQAAGHFKAALVNADHETRSVIESNIGLIMSRQGDLDGAIKLLRLHLESPVPRRRITRKINLAGALMMSGRFDESRDLAQSVCEEIEDHGPLGSYRALAMMRVAQNQLLLGDLPMAEVTALCGLESFEHGGARNHWEELLGVLMLIQATRGSVDMVRATAETLLKFPGLTAATFASLWGALRKLSRYELSEVVEPLIDPKRVPDVIKLLFPQQKNEPSEISVAMGRIVCAQVLKRL